MFCQKCGQSLPSDAVFCAKCGTKVAQTSAVRNTGSQSSAGSEKSKFDTLKFLKTAIELEQRKYEQENIIANLQSHYDSLAIRYKYTEPSKPTLHLSASVDDPFITILTIVMAVISIVAALFIMPNCEMCNIFPTISFLLAIALIAFGGFIIISFIIAFISDVRTDIYNHKIDMNDYKDGTEEYNKNIAAQEVRLIRENAEKPKIWEQIQIEKNALAETKNMITALHSLDVVYKKYRDIAALCSIYEYLESGRSSTLSEAYNKYDDELFHQRVISKFDEVITHLDSIQDTQYMLYSAISEGNKKIDSLTNATYQVASSIDYQREQTALSLEYQKQQAADINTMKWLEIMKY